MVACVCALTWADFFKTMESDQRPGLWQDVYRPVYEGHQVYVKLQIHQDAQAVVIQFKAR